MNDQNTTDQELAQRWADQQDHLAYEVLVDRYSAMIFGRCRRQLAESDADDACQAVFLVFIRRADQAAAHPVFVAWLLRVCDNVIRNAKRDRIRRHKREQPQATLPENNDMPEDDNADIMQHLDACIAELPNNEREIIELHYYAGLSYADIATQTDSVKATVQSRMQRGLDRMRQHLSKRGISVTSAFMLTCLGQLNASELPQTLSDRLKQMAPTADAAITTGVTASAQAIRWSQGTNTMLRNIILIAASILLICTVSFGYVAFAEDEPFINFNPIPEKMINDGKIHTAAAEIYLIETEKGDLLKDKKIHAKKSIPLHLLRVINPSKEEAKNVVSFNVGFGFSIPDSIQPLIGNKLPKLHFVKNDGIELPVLSNIDRRYLSVFQVTRGKTWTIGYVKVANLNAFLNTHQELLTNNELLMRIKVHDHNRQGSLSGSAKLKDYTNMLVNKQTLFILGNG